MDRGHVSGLARRAFAMVDLVMIPSGKLFSIPVDHLLGSDPYSSRTGRRTPLGFMFIDRLKVTEPGYPR